LSQTCFPDGRNKKYNFGGESFWKIAVLGNLKCNRIMLGLILGKQVERLIELAQYHVQWLALEAAVFKNNVQNTDEKKSVVNAPVWQVGHCHYNWNTERKLSFFYI
jgi:hypothetical protein